MTWRPTLRIAAREARRAKARSALIVAMVALPVLALSFADVMWRTAEPSQQERLTRLLGSSDASLFMIGSAKTPALQAADPTSGHYTANDLANGDLAIPGALEDLDLPAGTRLLVEASRDATMTTSTGTADLGWTEVDAADPAMRGRWILDEGRFPANDSEVMVTPAMSARTGARVGDTLTLTAPTASYTVVGVISQNGARGALTAVARPGTLIGAPGGLPASMPFSRDTGFLVGAPVTWQHVQAMNQQGAVVTSRAVLLDPPATTAFERRFSDVSSSSMGDYLVIVLLATMIVGLGCLIVVLLAGTAFAVGARRQARSLAVVAAGGGDRKDLRRVVLGSGLVLGVAAGAVGVLLGVALAALVDQLLWRNDWLLDADLASFDVRPLDLLVIAGIGVATGVLAAVVPARQAARLDVVAALRGRSGASRRSRRTPLAGILMVAVGVVLTVLGSGWVVTADRSGESSRANLVVAVLVGAAALVLLGLVTCAGSVVTLVARIAPRLPLAGRLALRDADRHRGRTAPAVAAVLAAVSGSVAVMLYVSALNQHDQQTYTLASPVGTSTVPLTTWGFDPVTGLDTKTSIDANRALATVGSVTPVESSLVVESPVDCEDRKGCARITVVKPPANRCQPGSPEDRLCHHPELQFWGLPDLAIGGAELLEASGYPATDAANQTLAAGGVVVTDPLLLDDNGMVRLKYRSGGGSAQPDGAPVKVVTVPGTYVPPEQSVVATIVSPKALSGMALPAQPRVLLLRTTDPVTQAQEDAVNAALTRDFDSGTAIQVERGYESTYGLGLLALAAAAGIVTLGATGIATGLALTDARADHATLAAVGAAPGLRRRLAAAQSLLLGFLGVLLGIAAGVVPALSIIGASPSLEVVWPWPQLAVLVVGVPLLAGAFAYLFTRSTVPMQRRVVA
jgi:putative ABC transport system permease protein